MSSTRLSFLRRLLSGLSLGLALSWAGAAEARVVAVNSTADNLTAGDGRCTVREALRAVLTRSAVDSCPAGDGNTDTITLPAGTITLASTLELAPLSGQFTEVRIAGKGYLRTTLKARALDTDAVFHVQGDVQLELLHLTVGETDFSSVSRAARGLWIESFGGATLRNVRMIKIDSGNNSVGGCIFNAGSLYVVDSSFIYCKAGFAGGAIANAPTGGATIEQTTIDGEDPMRDAQGNPRDQGDNAEHAGGVRNQGDLSIISSTLARIRGGVVSALQNLDGGFTTLRGVTVAFNRTLEGSSSAAVQNTDGTLEVLGSIIINNINAAGQVNGPGTNCGGAVTSLGHNILGTNFGNTCATLADTDSFGSLNLLKTDPDFAAAGHNAPMQAGGLGAVYLHQIDPSCSSPCRSATQRVPVAEPFGFCNDLDQRGVARARTFHTACDIGAVQRAQAMLVVGNRNAMTGGDRRIQERMTALGYFVLVRSDEENPAGLRRSLTVIADSASPSVLGQSFLGAEGSVLVMDRGLLPLMLMTNATNGTDYGSTGSQTRVSVPSAVARDHTWIGRTGDLTNPALTSSSTFGWGVPVTATQSPLDRTATIVGSSTRRAIFRYRTFDTMAEDFVTSAPRSFFFGTDGAVANLNSTGNRYLEETILATDVW